MKGVRYTPYGHYSLKKAVFEGRIERVREIIRSPSIYHSQEWLEASDGSVLLCTAIEKKHTEIAKLLLTNGSRVNSKTKNPSATPLHFAVENGDIEIIQMLLDKDANINALNISGHTPFHLALLCKKIEIIHILLNRGARVEPTNRGNIIPMHIATDIGSEEIINLLLSKGANVNAKNADGKTAIHLATKRGYSRIVEHLLTHGAYVNACDNQEGYTPLHLAARNGNKEIMQLLLSKHANVNAEAKDGITSLHIALKHGCYHSAELLLKYGANVNAVYNTSGREDSYTPLHLAVENGSKRVIKLLLSKRANVNAEAKDGITSLHIALDYGYKQIAEHLLKYGANVNAVYNTSGRKEGYTPLHLAARNGSEEIIKLLLSKGANVNAEAKDGITSLHIALKYGCNQIAEHLLKYGANVNAVYNTSGRKEGHTPLHLAARNGSEEIIKLLLSKGANVNAKAKDGITSLHIALKYGCDQIAEFLKYGANVNAVYNISGMEEGYTPLHLAARNGSEKNTKLLLNKGANVNAEAKDGITSLHLAIQMGQLKIVEHLLKCGANVNAIYCSENEGYTPLHLAAKGHLDIIELLLKFGASVNSTDEYGITALHIASKNRHEEIVTALLEHGSDTTIISKKNYTALDFAMYPHKAFDNDHMYSNYGHVNIVKILKHHMVKIKAANLYAVNKDILSISSSTFGSDDEELSDFQNECEKEIASMKNEVINDNITLYDILTGSVRLLARYATNECIVKAFGSDNYKKKFPIYASIIKSNCRKGEKEKEFMEKGDQIFGFLCINNFPWLPRDCTEKILSYLNYEDLI